MRHDLTTLRLVLAVSEAGSISRGADRVNLALAAASCRIHDPTATFELVIGMPRREHVPTLTLQAFDELAPREAAVLPSALAA